MEHVERQGHIETIGGFPLDLRILNVGQLECCGALQELHIAEVGTCGVVIHIVIAGDFETCGEFCVIDCAHLEPILIGEHPTGLHRGEESPFHARYLDSAVGFATKTRGAFCASTEFEEVAVHVVVIRIGIVAEVDPTVVDTTFADVLQRVADVGHLVVVVVVTTRVAVRIRIGAKTETTEDIKLMLAVVTLPIDAEIVEECGFLTKLRSGNALHIAETFDRLTRRTIAGHIILLVAAVERVGKTVAQRPVVIDLVLGGDIQQELGLLLVVLVVAFTVFENPIGIGQTGIAELRSKAQGVTRLGIVHAGVDTIVVNKAETVVAQIANIVGVRVYEGRLRQTKHIGRGDVAICIALGPTVVAKVVGIAHIGHVQFGRETLEEVHIGVEADVQTIERVVFGRGLCVGISQREVVHGHVITTLYADTIVLRNGSAVKILGPVRIIVELLVVKVGGIFVEEGDDHR